MNATYIMITVVVVLVIVGVILSLVFSRRNQTRSSKTQFGPEYDHAVETFGNEKKAAKRTGSTPKTCGSVEYPPTFASAHERYLADWTAVQSKFVDEPGQAIVDADRLIMEVMQVRAYPVSNFEQRAADISVNYPALVSNYRAARVIALKNEQHQADTEEFRQAIIYYRSLFEELLELEPAVAQEKSR